MKWPIGNKSRSVTQLYNYKVLGDPVFVESENNPHVNMVLSSQTSNRHGIWDKVQVTAFGRLANELQEEYKINGKPYRVHDGCILTVEVLNTYAPRSDGGVYENHVLQDWSPVIADEATTPSSKKANTNESNEKSANDMMTYLYDTFGK